MYMLVIGWILGFIFMLGYLIADREHLFGVAQRNARADRKPEPSSPLLWSCVVLSAALWPAIIAGWIMLCLIVMVLQSRSTE